MEEKIKEIKISLDEELSKCLKEAELLNIKSKYLGKNSELVSLMSNLKQMSNDEKKKYGRLLNETKNEFEAIFDKKLDDINNAFKEDKAVKLFDSQVFRLIKIILEIFLIAFNSFVADFLTLSSIYHG